MSVCKNVKTFSRTHEHIADFFSLLAVALLFATIWAVTQYYQAVSVWLLHDVLLHGAILVAVVILDVFLIIALLAIGSARFGEATSAASAPSPGDVTIPGQGASSAPGSTIWKALARSTAEVRPAAGRRCHPGSNVRPGGSAVPVRRPGPGPVP